MQALVLQEYNRFEYTDVPDPELRPDEVLVRIKAAGICGSDIHGMDGSSGRRVPPVIMGHEASGVIEDTGRDVTGWETGARITFDSTVYCGACGFCRRGQVNLCEHRRVLGVSTDGYKQDGAFAEYLAVPARILYHLPESVSFEQGALVEPCAIAFHAVERTPVSLGDTAIVVGCGIIGSLVIQALRLAGCGRIAAVDLRDDRLRLAESLGADDLWNPRETDVPEAVRGITEGMGADIGFEVVGNSEAFNTALLSVRKGGVVTLVGNISPEVQFPEQYAVTREVSLIGSCASAGEYPACINMIARGEVNTDRIISATAPLSEGADWFDRLYREEEDLVKVILRP